MLVHTSHHTALHTMKHTKYIQLSVRYIWADDIPHKLEMKFTVMQAHIPIEYRSIDAGIADI